MIEEKTVGVLIDELITTNIRCWFAQERIMKGKCKKKISKAAKLAQKLNKRRTKLIQAIDKHLGFDDTLFSKSY